MLTLLLALFIVMFAMAKVDDEKFQEIKSEFGTILSSHHSNSSVIGSVIDMGETTPRKAATSAEAQAQEAAVRTQLENQQLENQRPAGTRAGSFWLKRADRSPLGIRWLAYHACQQHLVCLWQRRDHGHHSSVTGSAIGLTEKLKPTKSLSLGIPITYLKRQWPLPI